MIHNIRGAIFDIDGTLLDSMPIWGSVAGDYLRSCGCVPRPNLNDELRDLGGHQLAWYFQTHYGIRDSAARIHGAIGRLLEDFYYNVAQLKDGAVQLLESFRAAGIRMCAATATDRHLIARALERCGVVGYFGRIFTCGEERTSKSRPDIYLRAADFLGTGVRETLVFEDALYAIRSARGAGFPIVGVYDASADDQQDEIKALCDCYVYSLVGFDLSVLAGLWV